MIPRESIPVKRSFCQRKWDSHRQRNGTTGELSCQEMFVEKLSTETEQNPRIAVQVMGATSTRRKRPRRGGGIMRWG